MHYCLGGRSLQEVVLIGGLPISLLMLELKIGLINHCIYYITVTYSL